MGRWQPVEGWKSLGVPDPTQALMGGGWTDQLLTQQPEPQAQRGCLQLTRSCQEDTAVFRSSQPGFWGARLCLQCSHWLPNLGSSEHHLTPAAVLRIQTMHPQYLSQHLHFII